MMKKTQIENEELLRLRVERELRSRVRRGELKKGARLPGERQLAGELAVSRGTLRSALEMLELSGFLHRVPGKGTFIRDDGVTVRNLNIGYIFPEPEISLVYQSYGNYAINSEVWRGIMEYCVARGITASFIPAQAHASERVDRALCERIKRDCSGVILPSREFPGLAALLEREKFPFCYTCPAEGSPHVFYDVEKGVGIAARKLLESRCRSVVMLNLAADSSLGGSTWEMKIRVFRREFARAGFPIPDAHIIQLPCEERGVLQALRQVLPEKRPLPDCFFTATPMISFALLHIAAERHWEIPGKVQILGYANDMNMRRTIPELTCVRLPHAAIGRTAADHLANFVLNGTPIPAQTLLEAELVPGETTR